MDFCLVLQAFGVQFNASSMVEDILSDWRRFFNKGWIDFAHLTRLSFHKLNGEDCMDDTTVANQPKVLHPVIDGPVGDHSKKYIQFVCVQCTINFTGLVTINPYPIAKTIRVTYFIELPQGTQALINSNNQNYNLVSFLGTADVRTLTPLQVKTNILGAPVQLDAPVLLHASDFNLWYANTNSNDNCLEIDHKILKLARHQICASVFAEICIGYTNQPQALDLIKQCCGT
jgi:hypothetical protein